MDPLARRTAEQAATQRLGPAGDDVAHRLPVTGQQSCTVLSVVTKVLLDLAQVDVLLQQARGVRMTQRMHVRLLADAGGFQRLAEGGLHGAFAAAMLGGAHVALMRVQEWVAEMSQRSFGHRLRVGDAFSGIRSIPYEAASLGCDVYASDLNPMAAKVKTPAERLGDIELYQFSDSFLFHCFAQPYKRLTLWPLMVNKHPHRPFFRFSHYPFSCRIECERKRSFNPQRICSCCQGGHGHLFPRRWKRANGDNVGFLVCQHGLIIGVGLSKNATKVKANVSRP